MNPNPTGLDGISFVEFAGDDLVLDTIFVDFGFSRVKRHPEQDVVLYQQGEMHILINREDTGFAAEFKAVHGPSICSMGWRVKDAAVALERAVAAGARPFEGTSPLGYPAIYGIGDSLIYFVEGEGAEHRFVEDFVPLERPLHVEPKGFVLFDHLTNNVPKGTMLDWANFYKNVFGFTEVRYFHIRGTETGLTSYALQSPCKTFCIPINEGSEDKSQIEEYLREYKGAGVQHLAFLTNDLLGSLDRLGKSSIEMLDIDDEYYSTVFDRVPGVKEDPKRIQDHMALVDGDEDGYLLQIFTKNLIGPIFIELIQRNNHTSFGEGNFGALFRSIERDQAARGVL